MKIIDASECIMGRLASSIAKELFSENIIKLSLGKKRHIKVKLN